METDSSFIEISPYSIPDNVFELIDKEWFLITAGSNESNNCMTASWGSLGILWNKPVASCFIRPVRNTYGYVEKYDAFTLSFFDRKFRSILNYCGSKSGRDVDKVAATGLIPLIRDKRFIYYEQARLVLCCRKIYFQDLIPGNFLDPGIEKHYPNKDYHRLFMGEIVACLRKK
jgi:flavin reductase (DIM6/NTAB) family NADH-FMN oxidoreductase RutF